MDSHSFVEHASHERTHWWFVARHRIIDDLVTRLLDETIQVPTVIEIGCGTGALVDRLAARFDACGADISSYAIEIARSNYPDRRFLVYRQLPELAQQIAASHVVLLLDVLEHVDDDFELLSQIASFMSPGSTLLITVPGDPNLWSRHDEAMFHFRRYTPQRLSMLWRDLPLTPRLFSGFNWRLAPLIRTARKIGNARTSIRGDSAPAKTDLRRLPRFVNQSLLRIFSSESKPLQQLIGRVDEDSVPHRGGISLIAALRRDAGEITPRTKPDDCPPDDHTPPAVDFDGRGSMRDFV